MADESVRAAGPQAALGAAAGHWVPPSARPVSDVLYTPAGGLPEAVQRLAEVFLDAQEDEKLVHMTIWLQEPYA